MLYLNHIGRSNLGPPGIKWLTIWVNGCNRNCEGCISAAMNRTAAPVVLSVRMLALLYTECRYEGLIFSGGEPFLQAKELVSLVNEISRLTENKPPLICYTGNTIEEIKMQNKQEELELLKLTDVLIDGPYIKELDTGNRYFGSDNQRIIFLTDRYHPEDFPHQERSIVVEIHSNRLLTMSGIPSVNEAAAWQMLKE